MIARIDHISIAVKDQKKAEIFFQDVFGAVAGAAAEDPNTRFFWRLFSLGDLSRLEIISPTGEGSFLDKFFQNKEAGVHHITLQTPDIRQAMKNLEAKGIPYFGFYEYPSGIWKEIYIHPRHAFGVLLQIAEFEADDWLPENVKFPAGKRWQVEKTEDGASLVFAHPGGGKVFLKFNRQELRNLLAELSSAAE